jgi:hypothetical protein
MENPESRGGKRNSHTGHIFSLYPKYLPQALNGNGRASKDYRSDIFCRVPVGVPGFPPKNFTPTLPVDS